MDEKAAGFDGTSSCPSCEALRQERDRLQVERDLLREELKRRTSKLMHRINELGRALTYGRQD